MLIAFSASKENSKHALKPKNKMNINRTDQIINTHEDEWRTCKSNFRTAGKVS